MGENYTVEQGDCISSIAYEHGFFWKTLWNHSANSELKQKRKDPNILMEEDVVHIPDLTIKQESGATENKHKFKMKGVPAKLRLRLISDGKPRAGEEYLLVIDGATRFNGNTDADGKIDHGINPNARVGRLVLQRGREEYLLNLGHLDPVDQISGIQARLNGLGYYCGEVNGVRDGSTQSAIARFQHAYGLKVDGKPNADTQAKVKEIFAC